MSRPMPRRRRRDGLSVSRQTSLARRAPEHYRNAANMNMHRVTLNGQAVAVGRDHLRLLTMVRSMEHHDVDGNTYATHELVMEGVDTFGRVATHFVPPVPLKEGDIVQILIGDDRRQAAQ
jgi:hypothetical protein